MSLELKTEAQYAKWRDCSIRTVQRERAVGVGPPFIRLGRKIFYRPEAIQNWLLAHEQKQPRAPQ